MARERMIYPEMLDSESFQSLSLAGKVLWVALLLMADDYGRGKVCEDTIKGKVFPRDKTISPKMVGEILQDFQRLDFIKTVDVGLSRYFYVLNWDRYQHPRYRKPSKIPPLEDFGEISEKSPKNLGEISEISPKNLRNVSDQVKISKDKIDDPPYPPKELPEAEVLRQHIAHFNEHVAPKLLCSTVHTLSDTRLRSLRARLLDFPDLWERILAEVPRLDSKVKGSPWLNFDFLMSENNLAKYLDGNYRPKGGKA